MYYFEFRPRFPMILLFITLAVVNSNQQADYVTPEELKSVNITLSEQLYAGYLPVKADGSA